jgi:hypothetical protein
MLAALIMVHKFISTRVSVPSSEMGPSPRVCLFPLLVLVKSMHTRLRGNGWGTQFRRRAENLVLYVYYNPSAVRPDELKVTTSNGIVQIEGKHEETAPDGKTKLTRQFSRRSA